MKIRIFSLRAMESACAPVLYAFAGKEIDHFPKQHFDRFESIRKDRLILTRSLCGRQRKVKKRTYESRKSL